MPKLNPKQAAFVNNINSGMTQTAAYMKAYGVTDEKYAFSAASRLVRNDKVAVAISESQKRAAEKAEMTRDEWLDRYIKIARSEVTTEKVTKTGIVELPPDFNEQMKALDSIGKTCGWVEDKFSGTMTVRVVQDEE